MALYGFFAFWAFVLGTVIGSFLNVCVYRMPRDEAVSGGRSHCPHCRHEIRARDLIPLLSQVLLRNRCRDCGQPIGWRYFAVEATTGLIFLLSFLHYVHLGGGVSADWPGLARAAIVFPALLAIFIIDFEHYIIPDELIWAVAVVGIGYDLLGLVFGWSHLLPLVPVEAGGHTYTLVLPRSIAGAVVGYLGLYVFTAIADRAFRKETMGFGDIKLTGAVGANLGPAWALVTYIVLAAFLGAIVGIGLLLVGRRRRGETMIPFGPWLAISAATMILFGGPITAAVRSLFVPPQ